MTKRLFVSIACGAALLYGCSKEQSGTNVHPASTSRHGMPSGSGFAGYNMRGSSNSADYSASIPVDSANRLIESYLTSVEYPSNELSLRSLTFSGDSLRAYLSNPNVKTIKFMLAHQPEYVNTGHFGVYAGMNPEALTLVIAGLDENGNFVLNNQNEVYEHCAPCPFICNGVSDAYIQ